MEEIGKLEEVNLRELWKNEEKDFSTWLAEKENIEYLNDILGLTLTDIKTEEHVRSRECDIFAIDEARGTKVVIENQLEESDPDHLGRIITYASGLDASVVVWIVKRARDEHKSAIEWLNNNTKSNINFFLLEIHAYRIGDSLKAPKFEVIEQPNGFIKFSIAEANKNEITKTDKEIFDFWTKFNDILIDRGKPFKIRKVSYNRWYDITIGCRIAKVVIDLVNQSGFIRIGLYIDEEDKKLFDKLFNKKEEIENELKMKLIWTKDCRGNVSRIEYDLYGLDYNNHSNYEILMNQTIDIADQMQQVFKKHI